MSAINQYIDLYNRHRKAIDTHSGGAVNAIRQQALRVLSDAARMPEKGDEDYEVTSLEEVFAPDYGVNINRIDLGANPAEVFRCDVPNLSTCLYFLRNDAFFAGKNSDNALPKGVVICSLAEAAVKYASIVDAHYGKIARLEHLPTALNSLLAQDGVFVYVPQGVQVEKPVQLVNILNSSAPLMACRRILLVAEDGAQIRLLSCDHTQNPDIDYLNSQVIEIYAGRNAVVDFYDIEDSSDRTRRVSSMYIRQEEASNVLVDGITLKNGITRNDFSVDMVGNHAELHLLGMAMASGNRHVDNHTEVVHKAEYGHTDELFKYVLDGNAVGAFSGLIRVLEGADKTEAYQSNRNVLASDEARMYSKPQLVIDCDDVKCSHGSTIGQIDQTALFYMRSRGIPEQEARLMLMQAFMNDVIAGVRMDALKDRLRHLVETHILGGTSSCRDCASSCNQKK